MNTYRTLCSREAFQCRNHLLRLDEDSRSARFAARISDNTVRRYCADIDWRNTRIVGYFQDGILRAAVEVLGFNSPSSVAELAFSVEAPFQDKRIGTNLMVRARTFLRDRGVTRSQVFCLLTNRRMRCLASELHNSR